MEKMVEELVEVFDEDKLKSYLEKDNSVEEILTGKIEELKSEKGKLSDKELELKKLESSYRDKLTRDVSTDELRNIADEIDKIKSEVSNINTNIDKLESDLNDMIETKKQTEKSKEDYITVVSKTISDYEKKLEAIDNAIKVCDNDALKSAYEEEKEKMQSELSSLKSKREEELDKAISTSNNNSLENDMTKTILENDSELNLPDDKVVTDEEKDITLPVVEKNPEIELPMSESQIESDEENISKIIEKLKQEINTENLSPVFDEVNISNIDSPEKNITPDIDLNSETIDIANIISETNNNDGKMITDTSFVPAEQVGDIFRSGSIMPLVYDKLDSYIEEDKEAM